MDGFDKELDGGASLVFVLLNRVADAERFARMDVLEVLCAVEHDAVHDLAACLVNEVELDVLVVSSDEFRRSEVGHSACAEHRLVVARSKGVEVAQKREEFGGDFRECQICVDVELRGELVGTDVVADKLFEAPRISRGYSPLSARGRQRRCGLRSFREGRGPTRQRGRHRSPEPSAMNPWQDRWRR